MNKAKVFPNGVQIVLVDNKPHELLQKVASMTKVGTAKIGHNEHDIYMSGSTTNVPGNFRSAISKQIFVGYYWKPKTTHFVLVIPYK